MKIFKSYLLAILFAGITVGQNYEIKFDSLNASGWFGGDDRPGQQRNVAVAQSILIGEPITLETFSFYFTSPFDSINGVLSGHEVTLKLHVRDSIGIILQADTIVVPDTFSGGWITWSDINYDLTAAAKYIFSAYLIGGYDSNQVHSGIGCDLNSGYTNGEMYVKYVSNDSEAEIWGDWSLHSWDADFWLTGSLKSTDVEFNKQIIQDFILEQNYPNPFNPTTNIKFTIPNTPLSFGEGLGVRLLVYDVIGNEVATLVDEFKPAGTYEVEFNAASLPSGIYFYQLTAGEFIQTKKIMLLK